MNDLLHESECGEFIPNEKRKFTWWWTGAAMFALAVFYVLSYAPMVRLLFGPSHTRGMFPSRLVYYKPVEWLIDYTPAKDPLIRWARVWDVDDFVAGSARWREIGRDGIVD